MMLVILTAVYFLVSGLMIGALLTDKNINTNKQEALLCIVVGLLWPLAIAVAASFALFENIQEKLRARKLAKLEQLQRFCAKLHKLNLISKDTLKGLYRL